MTAPLLFAGYDQVLGKSLATCVRGTADRTGRDASIFCKICTDYETLASTLKIDASASIDADFGDFGGGVSDKFSMVRNLRLTSFSVSIVVGVTVESGTDVARDFSPIHEITFSSRQSLMAFVLRNGNSFLSSISTGGFYYAIYSFCASTKDEQDYVTNELSGHGFYDGITVNANLAQSLNVATSSVKTRLTTAQKIGGFSGITAPQNPDQVVDLADRLFGANPDQPVITSYSSLGYERVFDTPQNSNFVSRLVAARDFFTTPGTGLNIRARDVLALKEQTSWLQGTYAAYGWA
jgi:hypothetical protein